MFLYHSAYQEGFQTIGINLLTQYDILKEIKGEACLKYLSYLWFYWLVEGIVRHR